MNYLVTGGAGFIGSHLVEALVGRGDKVTVMDDLSTGKYENIANLADHIEFIEGSICDDQLLKRALQGKTIVFHQAAVPSVPRSIESPYHSHEVNVDGTLKLLCASREAGVKRVVFAGSSSVYGDSETLPKVETMTPNPCSPYAVTKLTGEYYCQVFSRVYSLETVTLRYFNVFGPRQDVNSAYAAVIPKFIDSIANGNPPTIYGDGEQTRDFTYIDNVVAANFAAEKSPNASGKAFNIACGNRISLNQLVEGLAKIFAKPVQARHSAPRKGDIVHSLADISQAQSLLGYVPQIDVWKGLEETVSWYRQS